MNSVHGPSPYILHSYIADETLGTGESNTPSSPPMQPRGIGKVDKYALPEPPPPLQISKAPVSFDTTLPPLKTGLISGDSQLLWELDNGRNPEIAKRAELQNLLPIDDCHNDSWHGHPRVTPDPERRGGAGGRDHGRDGRWNLASMKDESLKDMAAGALHKAATAAAESSTRESRKLSPIEISAQRLSIHDDRSRVEDEPAELWNNRMDGRNSISMQPGAGLPPIVSPNSESNGQSLPSIRSITEFGDMKHSPSDHDFARHPHGVSYPQSPPSHLPRLSVSHGSPPISPPDSYQRSLPSPNSLPASSPYTRFANSQPHPFIPEFGTASGASDLTGNEQGAAAQNDERMYINGTYGSSHQQATYPCDYPSCKAPPFQTQYLLNSHANVHSQARPHYCPVDGCARSEGGKGFKRKNEMIRHGLVHESPGYICPFCPEKDHRYPRPDNLQR